MATFATQTFNQIATETFINSVADAVEALTEDATAYTTDWHSAGVDPSPVTFVGWFVVQGAVCHFHADYTITGAFTAGTSPYTFALPVLPLSGVLQCHINAIATDTSAGTIVPLFGRIFGTGQLVDRLYTAAGAASGPTVPFTWANGDTLQIDGSYLIA